MQGFQVTTNVRSKNSKILKKLNFFFEGEKKIENKRRKKSIQVAQRQR